MSDAELSDLCRQIAAEHADRRSREQRRRWLNGSDPRRTRSGGSTPTPSALRDLSEGVLDEANEEPSR